MNLGIPKAQRAGASLAQAAGLGMDVMECQRPVGPRYSWPCKSGSRLRMNFPHLTLNVQHSTLNVQLARQLLKVECSMLNVESSGLWHPGSRHNASANVNGGPR